MTEELILLIKKILAKYKNTDLGLEMELCHAVRKMLNPDPTNRTAEDVRAEIEKALQLGAAFATKQTMMMDRAERACKRILYNLSGATQYEKERFYKFLVKAEAEGQTIEKFVAWATTDPFWNNKITSTDKIIELWYHAFPVLTPGTKTPDERVEETKKALEEKWSQPFTPRPSNIPRPVLKGQES